MTNNLQQYFPMIRTKEDILSEVNSNRKLMNRFYSWTREQRKEFLDFCTGAKGVKVLYDSFSKEVLNPENTPERLEDFLSLLIKRSVKILYTLPNDSTRIADESSLIITDIVVELEDGSIANVEVQKIGYKFPGERSACYSADMLLRQYKRVRDTRKRNFSYEDIKSIYTIVIFERCDASFREYPNTYIHYFEQCSDSGLKLELLQKYIFIPLDIFKKNRHNKPIENRLEAWLAFFSEDDPKRIAELIAAFPEFKFMYEDIYRICQNMEEVMGIFSEELRILDRNTVQLMIDEMQDELDSKRLEYALQKDEIQSLNAKLQHQENEKMELSAEINSRREEVNVLNMELSERRGEVEALNGELSERRGEVEALNEELSERREKVETLSTELAVGKEKINALNTELERINILNRKLVEENRIDDIVKASTNEAFRMQLLKEFGI
ncbi:PD-(D/E)XK nuclease family transposase [Lachnospiraceae bacterium JLR.KK008]